MRSVSGWLAHEIGPVVIRDDGTDQTPRAAINFIGATVADNEADDSVDITVSGGSTPTGTGFTHITAGSQDAAAKLVENADVHASAAIALSKTALSANAQTFLGTPSSANLKTLVTDETGSGGALVFATSPTLTTPVINGQIQGATVAVAAMAIDWTLGPVFTKTLAAGANTFTFANQASGMVIVVRVTSDGGGSTLTWPTVLWAGGTPPTQTSTGVDVYTFVHDGTSIYGSVVQDMS